MPVLLLLLACAATACTGRDAAAPATSAAPATTAAPAVTPSTPAAATPVPPPASTALPPPPSTATPGAPTTTPPAAGLARFDGYGDLRFGMDATAVRKAWGGELRGVPEAAGPCYYLTPKWVKRPADFALMMEGGHFVRYDIGTDKELAPGGGRRGMSADEIRALYPGRVEDKPHKYTPGGHYLRIRDAAGGDGVLVFETDAAGKVTAWRAGLAPQVDYIEGCA